MKFTLIFLILTGYCFESYSQKIDNNDIAVIKKVDSLVSYAKSIWYANTDSAKATAELILQFSKENSYIRGEAKAYNILGVVSDIYGDLDRSLTFYKKSYELFSDLGDGLGKANTQYNMALVLQNDEQFVEALDYVEKAYEYYRAENLRSKTSMASMTLGNLFLNNNRPFLEAIEKMKDAERIAREDQDTLNLCYALNLQGDAYVTEHQSMDSAVVCFQKSIPFLKSINNHWNLGFSYVGLAKAYLQKGDFNSALFFNDSALDEYRILNQKLGFRNTYENRKEIFEKMGDYESAVESYKMLKLYSDSIYSEQRSKQISRMKTEYETEKKEAEIISLSQQADIQALEIRQKNLGILIGLIVILFASLMTFFFVRQKSLKNRETRTEIEQRFLRSQLNPHFIFNALTAIQNFMLKNSADQAAVYLGKFSKLMREILENSREEFIPVEAEVDMLTNYLEIHKLRLNNSFEFKIEVDELIDRESDTIPPMFVQPFVENAIEHGIIDSKDQGLIELHFKKENEYISIEVVDNGGGLQRTEIKDAKHRSLATTIIQERMALFNKSLKEKIQLVLEEKKNSDGQVVGMRVELKVPFSYV